MHFSFSSKNSTVFTDCIVMQLYMILSSDLEYCTYIHALTRIIKFMDRIYMEKQQSLVKAYVSPEGMGGETSWTVSRHFCAQY